MSDLYGPRLDKSGLLQARVKLTYQGFCDIIKVFGTFWVPKENWIFHTEDGGGEVWKIEFT